MSKNKAKVRKNYDHLLSLLLLGDSSVGKSALLLRFAENNFAESFIATIGIDFKIKTIKMDNKVVKLQIWDTAGQEKFRTITSAYYRGAMGILLVYDITDNKSFLNVNAWMKRIQKYAAEEVIMVLAGNKTDLTNQRVITTQQGQEVANSYHINFFETSAKLNTNVEEAFLTLSQQVLEKWADKSKAENDDKGLTLNEENTKSSNIQCCK